MKLTQIYIGENISKWVMNFVSRKMSVARYLALVSAHQKGPWTIQAKLGIAHFSVQFASCEKHTKSESNAYLANLYHFTDMFCNTIWKGLYAIKTHGFLTEYQMNDD